MAEKAADDEDDDSSTGGDDDEEGAITEIRFVPRDKVACECKVIVIGESLVEELTCWFWCFQGIFLTIRKI